MSSAARGGGEWAWAVGGGEWRPASMGRTGPAGDSVENGLMRPAAAACTEGGECAWAGGAEWRRAFIGLNWAGPRQ